MSFQFLRNNIFITLLAVFLYFGWINRDDNYLSAESGPGYLLGIVGGSLMLILLMYPLSKRIAVLTRWIPVRYWFGIHMLFGIIGPVMILFHSNFHLGSTNSTVALVCMVLVACSGLVGRYIYSHIHHGLYGARITLKELNEESENNHTKLLDMYTVGGDLKKRLGVMEEKALQPYTGMLTNIWHVISMAFNAWRLKKHVKRLVKEGYKVGQPGEIPARSLPDNTAVIDSVNRYALALRRTAAFNLYVGLFSLWHILHLPLFFMMIITAVIHIFAVHMY
jgi:hypothetical protein